MSKGLERIPTEHWRNLGIPEHARIIAELRAAQDKTDSPPTHPREFGKRVRELKQAHIERAQEYEYELGVFNHEFELSLLKELEIPDYITVDHTPTERQKESAAALNGAARQEDIVAALRNQRETIADWFDYLYSPDTNYPDWFKIYALRSIIRYTNFDPSGGEKIDGKPKGKFYPRGKNVLRDFPRCNARALANVYDTITEELKTPPDTFKFIEAYESHYKRYGVLDPSIVDGIPLEPEPVVFRRINTNSARIMKALRAIPGLTALLPKNSAQKLVSYLENAGTKEKPFPIEWCIAGIGLAEKYTVFGDVAMYYSKIDGAYYPRLAVAYDEQGQVHEVRGIGRKQGLDDGKGLWDEVENILSGLNGGKEWLENLKNLRALESCYEKLQRNEDLSDSEIRLAYGQAGTIFGFGYGLHPLVRKIREHREMSGKDKMDQLVAIRIEDWKQGAWKPEEVTESTRAYFGPMFKGMFQKLPKEARLFDGSIFKPRKVHHLSRIELLDEFRDGKDLDEMDLIVLPMSELGLANKKYTLQEIYEHAQQFGLEYPPLPLIRPRTEIVPIYQRFPFIQAFWGQSRPKTSLGKTYLMLRHLRYSPDHEFYGDGTFHGNIFQHVYKINRNPPSSTPPVSRRAILGLRKS